MSSEKSARDKCLEAMKIRIIKLEIKNIKTKLYTNEKMADEITNIITQEASKISEE